MSLRTAKNRREAVATPSSARDDATSRGRTAGSQSRPSTERALQMLALIAATNRPCTLAELALRLDLPKATTSRVCEKLLRSGYLVREPGGKLIGIGPRLFRLGLDIVRHGGANTTRRALITQLVDDIGETCNLTTLAGTDVLYLDRVETRWPLRLQLEPGSRVPLHCTASGKLFLAHLPPTERMTLLDRIELTPNTPRTLSSRQRLLRELKRISAQGYSLDNEEFIVGLVAVAVPVTDAEGHTIAALACHAPVARLNARRAIGLVPRLQRIAEQIGNLTMTGSP